MHVNDQTNVPTNDARPAFLVGQDSDGHWLAIETHGLGGGLFRSRDTALHYARDACRGRPGAVRVAAEPLTLRI